jgi:type VI secretion system protein ImpK
MSPSLANRRPESLALIFQEVFTAIERFRAGRQAISDAASFRQASHEALRMAANQALTVGYNGEDAKLASFALVAFLDESVLASQNPVFADWPRQTLQEELFGTHIAGETFFTHLQQLLKRQDSPDLADVLEVHFLCMVLGFGGRYSAGHRSELQQIMSVTADKIRRIRGRLGPLSPAGLPPAETVQVKVDPWVRRLAIAAIGSAALLVVLFVLYKLVLGSGVRV